VRLLGQRGCRAREIPLGLKVRDGLSCAAQFPDTGLWGWGEGPDSARRLPCPTGFEASPTPGWWVCLHFFLNSKVHILQNSYVL
jgi:hypothetical protein